MKYANQYIITYLSVTGGIDNSQTEDIVLQSTQGIDTAKPGIACINWADPLDEDLCEWIFYTSIDGSNELQGVTRGAEKGAAKAHNDGVTVAFPVSETHINQFADIFYGAAESSEADNLLLEEQAAATTTPASGHKKIYAKTDDKLYTIDDAGAEKQILQTGDVAEQANNLFANPLINGNMDVWQRGTSFTSATTIPNNDDTYLMDRWCLISDGNDAVDVTRSTDAPEGSKYSASFDVETAKRFGIVQILENVDTTKLKGKTVSISFAVKSANISAIRAALLVWAGTADAVTSDVVGTWAATPTWATNWTAENTPADLTVTSGWTTVTIEGIDIDSATVNNLALAIWTPNEETIGDIVYISQVQMNEGATALPFQPKSYAEELRACQRYYFENGNGLVFGITTSLLGSGLAMQSPTPCQMRTSPTVTVLNMGTIRSVGGGASISVNSTTSNVENNPSHVRYSLGYTSGGTTNSAYASSDHRARFDAEL